mgnify:CR=1 FL=1
MENTYENKSVFSSMEQLENFLRKQEVENMAEQRKKNQCTWYRIQIFL